MVWLMMLHLHMNIDIKVTMMNQSVGHSSSHLIVGEYFSHLENSRLVVSIRLFLS